MIRELQPFEFNLRTKTRFGKNIADNLGKYLKELSFKNVGIIIDSAIIDNSRIKTILKKVNDENFEFVKIWKYNLNTEPDYDTLDEVKGEFLDKNGNPLVECFVGIGGGSVIDFAKGLATLSTNPGPSRNYRGFPTDLNPSLPTMAIPTTAGTASEVTYNAVFTDKKMKKKLGINTMNNFPVLSILDPTLQASCPKSVTVSTGMDAMVHILESYAAIQSNTYTKIFAINGFKFLFNGLSEVLDKPKDIDVRANILFGSYLGGISLMNSGSGPAAGLSYILGTNFDVPHGIAGAVFLPHIIRHNVENGFDYSELYDLIYNVDMSVDRNMKNKLFSEKIFELCNKLDVPSSLESFGVNEGNIDILLKKTEELGKVFEQNPVLFSIDDGKNLLRKMIKTKENTPLKPKL